MLKNLVRLKNISKAFGENLVLDNVNFDLKYGKIHALIGENGAGKTMIANVFAGIIKPDSGQCFVEDDEKHFSGPLDAQRLGISIIHQEINLAEDLTVAENIFLGKVPYKGRVLKVVDWDKLIRDSESTLDELGFMLRVEKRVDELSQAQKQMVEIAKAFSSQSKLIIMDEPYIGITQSELKKFYLVMDKLRVNGVTILYISHQLSDVLRISDFISVVRDGQLVVNNLLNEGLSSQEIIEYMSVRNVKDIYPKLPSRVGRTLFRVENLSTSRGISDITFNLRKGEILGIAGLVGSGRSAIARAIFGLDKLLGGSMYMNETQLKIKGPRDAIRENIGYISEDGRDTCLIKEFDVPKNITISSLETVIRKGIIKRNKEKSIGRSFVKKFAIKIPKLEEKVYKLSGGNQQKVLLSKWVFINSQVLILDEPTKNIDKGTKLEFYGFMNKYILEGKSIIFISSDIQELMGMSDRMLILYDGEIKETLMKSEFSEERIVKCASGICDNEKTQGEHVAKA